MAISANEFLLRAQLEQLIQMLNDSSKDLILSREKSEENILKNEEKSVEKQVSAKERGQKEIEDYASKEQDKRDKKTRDTWKSIGDDISKIGNSITSQFRSMMQEYVNEQQKLSYNLIGSGMTYDTVKNALSFLGTNAFVKQNEVYKNLTNLVSQGITTNAAQRAFLQTASQQVNLGFDTLDINLNKLIQLQQADLSEARMAQMAGLRTFLEQNYQNSQYIKQGFSEVSGALLQMQSLMNAQIAMSTEKTIQTYLGAFTSSGGSASGNIATALGNIGSGNFNLDSGMQNLMVMAASRAGLSYADILNNGLDANKSEALMNSLFGYIASIMLL